MIETILKKLEKKENLDEKEIDFFVKEYTKGNISEKEAEKIIREIYINGLTETEVIALTNSMVNSGEIFKWNDELLIDKHSTGGVGDKLTLVLMPILSEIGFKCAKMSGRSLGLTGGTADKLESIKGMNIDLGKEEFITNVNEIGIALMTQTEKIAPADKKIYALRDKKGLTDSIPLIASSIMSKKIAMGCKNLILDITCGSGAFMKNREDARKLGKLMCKIGEEFNINILAIITNMEEPLGKTVGNRLEVLEALNILNGEKGRLRDMAVDISFAFIEKFRPFFKEKTNIKIAKIQKEDIKEIIDSKKALLRFEKMLLKQGVSEDEINKLDYERKNYDLKNNIEKVEIYSKKDFEILKIDAHLAAKCAFTAGAGKENIKDNIEYSAGLVYNKLSGDKVKKDELLGTIYISKEKMKENKDEYIKNIQELFNKSIIEQNIENKDEYKFKEIIDII